jgi:hypothetical protein
MLYLLTSVLAVLGHGQQEPAHAPVRFGMTMVDVFDAFGEPFEFPGRLSSCHQRAMVDWLGGEECWVVWYDNHVVAPDDVFRAVMWKRQYRPFADPPLWLQPVVVAFDLREKLHRYFPPTLREVKLPGGCPTRKWWQSGK